MKYSGTKQSFTLLMLNCNQLLSFLAFDGGLRVNGLKERSWRRIKKQTKSRGILRVAYAAESSTKYQITIFPIFVL